jgi:hypothetical protein
MLAEKFFLFLETAISHLTDTTRYPDGAPKVVSRARHVPIQTSAACDGSGKTRSRRPLSLPRSGSMVTKTPARIRRAQISASFKPSEPLLIREAMGIASAFALRATADKSLHPSCGCCFASPASEILRSASDLTTRRANRSKPVQPFARNTRLTCRANQH